MSADSPTPAGTCDGGDCDRRAASMAFDWDAGLIPVCRRHIETYKVLDGTRWQCEDEWVGLQFCRRSRFKWLAQWRIYIDQRLTLAGFDAQRLRRRKAERQAKR